MRGTYLGRAGFWSDGHCNVGGGARETRRKRHTDVDGRGVDHPRFSLLRQQTQHSLHQIVVLQRKAKSDRDWEELGGAT